MEDFSKDEILEQSIRLKKSRLIRGLSIEEFSEEIGMSVSGYQKVERGQNAVSKRLLKSIWEKYNISSDFILYGEQQDVKKLVAMTEGLRDTDKLYILWNLAKYFVLSKSGEKFNRGIGRNDIAGKLKEWIEAEI